MSEHWLDAEQHNTPDVVRLLTLLGFAWRSPGFWSMHLLDGLELALEPQVMNAGAYKLQVYVEQQPLLRGELLVDVKPRPGN